MTVDVTRDAEGARVDWQFHELPARPLVRREIDLGNVQETDLEAIVGAAIAESPTDAVLTLRVIGTLSPGAMHVLSAANLRRLAPPTMNIELKLEDAGTFVRPSSPRRSDAVLELPF